MKDLWTPKTTARAIAASSLLNALTGNEVIVYLKLLGAVAEQGSNKIQILNASLRGDGRTAVRALRDLADRGLIKITRNDTKYGRTIEVFQ